MGTINSALYNASNALGVLGQAFNVVENNISNANTPEYADQTASFEPMPFDPGRLPGGVEAGPLISSRNEYLEQAVRSQQTALGYASQRAGDLGQVQSSFSLTSTNGIDTALNNFFNSFSQLSVSPNDTVNRQAVLDAANSVAQSFQTAAGAIVQVSTNVVSQTNGVVSQINDLAAKIAELNQAYESNPDAADDPSLDAQLHSDLLQLAGLANYSLIKNDQGGYNVFIGGQTALVIGGTAKAISADNSSNQTAIFDANGGDITSQITGGQLGALIVEQNTTLPGYLDSLNTLAQNFADTINEQLSQGVDQNGNTPLTPLFSYDAAGGAAATLTVNDLTPDQIAAASAGAPGGNGNAVAMAQLANMPEINGATFTQFFGNLGSTIGNDVAGAQSDQQQAQAQLTQAQSEVANASGVDLNAEAARLLQYQQNYDAVGKLVSVLDGLTQTLINMVNGTA
ncbi:MAG TPA: flagellar hook-associated protein FlgK [Bryobacteraceae bacterium]|jgi:flagellar hook-associated protein 1 FlgK|nr:flagellar hook-associated protein FlgK [Bryobacteraceae bacterium]